MHITKVELTNFKRFTDLTIDGIPPTTKLVLLIGSNGSGKSSVFDAFEVFNSLTKSTFQYNVLSYYKKRRASSLKIAIESEIGLSSIGEETTINTDDLQTSSFYGRTSFRQLSRLTRRQADVGFSIQNDTDRPLTFIDRDNRFENDIDHVSGQILRELFRDTSTAEQIRTTYIGAINKAFEQIFGDSSTTKLSLFEILPPLEGKPAQVNFRKGTSEIPYDHLSAGEKEVVNILINLLVRREYFTDTVYFFDELDLHLNTRLQFNLLKEITENWIPDNCQLWTASHSLGFIKYAQAYENGVIIDFDDLDFDQSQTLYPQASNSLDIYDIAVPKEMLFEIMRDKKIVFCENQNDEYYNLLALPKTLFVGLADARSVFLQIKNDTRSYALRDRDYLSDAEIKRIEALYPHYRILTYYDFENYLYHPDNIAELNPPTFSRDEYVAEIVRQKNLRFNAILLNLKSSRQYEELRTDDLRDKTEDSIVDDLQSSDFERFYKFFDIKKQFDKAILTKLNLDKKRLVQTNWFRQQIDAVLAR